jgi:hypothetical protein
MRVPEARFVGLAVAAAVGLATVVGAAGLSAGRQSSQGGAAIERLRQWIGAVRAHEIGEADSHATIAALWTHDDVAEMFPYLEALLQLVEAPAREGVAPSPQPRLPRPAPPPDQRRLSRLYPVEIRDAEVAQLRTLASLDWVQADPNRLLIGTSHERCSIA